MSLRWRLVAIFAGLGALAIGLATLTAYLSTANELRDEVDAFLLRRGAPVLEKGNYDGIVIPIKFQTQVPNPKN